MKKHLYLSLIPEALIASMLPPEEFGNYLAVGTKKRTRGEAIFFEVDMDFESDYFSMEDIETRCVPHPNGAPKKSKYISIYRCLEHVPIDKLRNLYLVTDDGRVLTLEPREVTPETDDHLHLYQQLAPVRPMVASTLSPGKFAEYLTDDSHPISVPKITFVEMNLGDLASDPVAGSVNDIPYQNIDHLRDCLVGLQEKADKPSKTVIRYFQGDLLYRMIKGGFYVGDKNKTLYYELPSKEELETKHYSWWRSALTVGF